MLFSNHLLDYLYSLNSKKNVRHSQSLLETVVTYDPPTCTRNRHPNQADDTVFAYMHALDCSQSIAISRFGENQPFFTYDSLLSASTGILPNRQLLTCGVHRLVPHSNNRPHASCAHHAPSVSLSMPNRRARLLSYLLDSRCCVPRATILTHVVSLSLRLTTLLSRLMICRFLSYAQLWCVFKKFSLFAWIWSLFSTSKRSLFLPKTTPTTK